MTKEKKKNRLAAAIVKIRHSRAYIAVADFFVDVKDFLTRKRYHSLYLELALSAAFGAVIAATIYIAAQLGTSMLISTQLASDIKKAERESEYIQMLDEYAKENKLSVKQAGRLIDVESSPYLRIAVYSDIPDDDEEEEDKVATREEMAAYAEEHGLYLIDLSDGAVMISLSDFSELYYYTVTASINFFIALLIFVIVMMIRMRKIINRIKRLQSDVAVVSYSDMNHAITVDGNNDVAKLAANVETMRLTILDNLKKEKEARDANTELITSLSHDVRTPLTVILGYLDMMSKKDVDDEMREYISITEQTAMRLKLLSDDMFKYFLIYGNAEDKINLEEYNANMLFSQMLTEHIVLLYEKGYEISLDKGELENDDKTSIITDADNLMRIFDNLFSNIHKYADKSEPIKIKMSVLADILTVEFKNKIANDTSGTESNNIGLKTCARLAELMLEGFEYSEEDGYFTTRIAIKTALVEAMPEIKPLVFSSSI